MNLVDTHCHLDFDAFDPDREAVLARAWEAGLARILNPGVDLASSASAVRLAESYPRVSAAVGIHPNEARTWNQNSRQALRSMIAASRQSGSNATIVAIGEIGLDYYRDKTPAGLQKQVLREQLELAGEVGLPVILHNRQATGDLLEILVEWHANLVKYQSPLVEHPGVLHSYSGDVTAALQAIELNFYIGFTGPVTFRNAPDLQQVAADLPLERLVVETDAPFLAPHPYRGKRNEPAYVRLVAEKIAGLHQVSLLDMANMTTANANRLFMW